MDLIKAIAGRQAVREYTAEAIGAATIRQLIDAAIQAPSAVNRQPWTFTVVRDQTLLDRISRDAKAHMLATLFPDPDAEHFRPLLEDPAFHIFYHAPVLILISAIVDDPWYIEDCSLAAENLMLAAPASGLGTCWIGFAERFLNTPDGKAAFGLPAAWAPVAPIIVGHAKVPPPLVARKEPVVRWVG
jgi:nitroreductase